MGEFESRSVKTREAVKDFRLLENSQKLCRGFQQAMEARTTCFFSVYKIILFIVNKKKDDVRSVYRKFSQLVDSQSNHIAHAIFVLSAMKTHL